MVALVLGATTILSSTAPVRVEGRASWYDYLPGQAAAGPALRAQLGDYEGRTVIVCVHPSVKRTWSKPVCQLVRLTDWCQCYRGEARERLIDLDRRTFARLVPPSRGLVHVTVRPWPVR